MMELEKKQRHEEVVSYLMQQIFLQKIKPGEKLPTENQLVETLKIDKTSLRVGLKELESMQMLDIRQGDGTYVKDFQKNAGIDFLRTLFLQGYDARDWLVDGYVIDEALEVWVIFYPEFLKLSTLKLSSRNIKDILDIIHLELQAIPTDRKSIVPFELQILDIMTISIGNIFLSLIINSLRPILVSILEPLVDLIDENVIQEHIKLRQNLFRDLLVNPRVEVVGKIDQYQRIFDLHRTRVKNMWLGLSKEERKKILLGSRAVSF